MITTRLTQVQPQSDVVVDEAAGNTTISITVRTLMEWGVRGPPGPPGPVAGALVKIASEALGGHRVVRSTSGVGVGYASADNPLHGDDVLGITQGAALLGGEVTITALDEITEPSWSWVPGEPLFLGLNGLPTQVVPEPGGDAEFSLVLGYAVSPTTIRVRIESPIYF